MTFSLKTAIKRYRDDEEASLSVEAIILLPVLLWAFMAMWIFFDNFRSHSIAQKAAYTIGDMLSRETDYIDQTYINNAWEVLQLLSDSDPQHTALRITVVRYDADDNEYQRVWSRRRGDELGILSEAEVTALGPHLPNMVDGEQLILTETVTRFDSIADIGLMNEWVQTFVFTRPRFAPQLVWSGA